MKFHGCRDDRTRKLNEKLGLPDLEREGRESGLWNPTTRLEWDDGLIETLRLVTQKASGA